MSSSLLAEAPTVVAFVCERGGLYFACEGLPFFKEHEGKQYCVLHYPGKEKATAFDEALKRKLAAEDFDFRGVWFPDTVNFGRLEFTKYVDFGSATFSAGADFGFATFNAGASFASVRFGEKANFGHTTFREKTFFLYATFSADGDFEAAKFGAEVVFTFATFGGRADFSFAQFSSNAMFVSATFSAETDFGLAKFDAIAAFFGATFKDYVRFAGNDDYKVFGDESSLLLQSKFEKPDRITFHTVTLRVRWFIGVDARKFEFINVNWDWRNIKQEIESLGIKNVSSAHRLLAIAYRNLAVNAEENHRYEEASRFRYMAMEARRLERWRGFAFWTLGWWYGLASGYGERVWRAFVVLIAVWLLAAALYTQVGFVRWEPRVSSEREAAEARRDEVGEPLRWRRALTYSLGVMTLQKPEPRPATNAAQALVMLETILGPVQA